MLPVRFQRDYVSECDLKKQSCKYDLPSSEGAQACVTLRGWLDYGNGVENVEFHQTDRVCTTGSESETKGYSKNSKQNHQKNWSHHRTVLVFYKDYHHSVILQF